MHHCTMHHAYQVLLDPCMLPGYHPYQVLLDHALRHLHSAALCGTASLI